MLAADLPLIAFLPLQQHQIENGQIAATNEVSPQQIDLNIEVRMDLDSERIGTDSERWTELSLLRPVQ